MLTIDAEKDLGISVSEFARRFRSWSDRLVVSCTIMCLACVAFWYHAHSDGIFSRHENICYSIGNDYQVDNGQMIL